MERNRYEEYNFKRRAYLGLYRVFILTTKYEICASDSYINHLDKTDRCIGLLNSIHLRRSINDSQEDPTVPSAPIDKLMHLNWYFYSNFC